jgi:hypothetical protein
LLWIGATFLVLTISGSKRGFYLLPLFPAAALLAAWGIGRLADRLRRGDASTWDIKSVRWPLGVMAGLMALLPVVAYVLADRLGKPEELDAFMPLVPPYVILAVAAAVGLAVCTRRKDLTSAALVLAATMALAAARTYLTAIPQIEARRGTEEFCRRVGEATGDRALYASAFRYEAELVFHLRRRVPDPIDESGQRDEFERVKASRENEARRKRLAEIRLGALRRAMERGPAAAILTAREFAEARDDPAIGGACRTLAEMEYRGETVYILGNDARNPH